LEHSVDKTRKVVHNNTHTRYSDGIYVVDITRRHVGGGILNINKDYVKCENLTTLLSSLLADSAVHRKRAVDPQAYISLSRYVAAA